MKSDESFRDGFTERLRGQPPVLSPAGTIGPTSDIVNAILSQSCDPPSLASCDEILASYLLISIALPHVLSVV
jgi:hypothetical protein